MGAALLPGGPDRRSGHGHAGLLAGRAGRHPRSSGFWARWKLTLSAAAGLLVTVAPTSGVTMQRATLIFSAKHLVGIVRDPSISGRLSSIATNNTIPATIREQAAALSDLGRRRGRCP